MSEGLSKKISIYNFIFTIGIVIYHCKNFNILFSRQTNVFLDKVYNLYDLIGYISMGFFFMLSAYLFYVGLENKSDIYRKIKKRLFTLGIPFLAWNCIFLLYEIFYGIIKSNLKISIFDLIWGFTFKPFDGPLWYVLALLLLMLIAPIVFKLKNRPNVLLGIVVGVLVGSNIWKICVVPENATVEWISRLVMYLPFYFLGTYLGLCKSDVVSKGKYNYKLVHIISICISIVIIAYFVFWKQNVLILDNVLLFILPIAIWLSTNNSLYEKIKIRYPLKVTFFIYAMHMLLIGIMNTVLTKLIGYGSLPPMVSFFAHFVFVAVLYGICLAVAYVTGKILPSKIYFALSGGRVVGSKKNDDAHAK